MQSAAVEVSGRAVSGRAVSGRAVSGRAVSGRAVSDEAVTELEGAIGLYATGPGPGEHHSRKCQMLAHTDLAIARLRLARSTPRSRSSSPSWPCRRASAPR